MRASVVGLMVAVGVAWCLVGNSGDFQGAYAQRYDGTDPSGHQSSASTGNDLVAISGAISGGQQTLLLIDQSSRRLASYQVDTTTGKVALRSVRNIRWDLEMDEFNGTEPSPERIRALLQSQ